MPQRGRRRAGLCGARQGCCAAPITVEAVTARGGLDFQKSRCIVVPTPSVRWFQVKSFMSLSCCWPNREAHHPSGPTQTPGCR